MELSMWTLAQWMERSGLEVKAKIRDGGPRLTGFRLEEDGGGEHVRLRAGESDVRLVSGGDEICLPGCSLPRALDEVSRAFEHYTLWENELLRRVVNRRPLQELVDLLYQLMERPVLLRKCRTGRMVASTRGYDGCEDGIWKRLDETWENLDDAVRAVIARREEEDFKNAFRPRTPWVSYTPRYQENVLRANVFEGSQRVFEVEVAENGRPFDQGDPGLVQVFSRWLEDYVTHYPMIHFSRSEVSARLIQFLDQGRLEDREIEALYRDAQWNEGDTFMVFCCEAAGSREENPMASVLRDKLEDGFPAGCAVVCRGAVVLLVPCGGSERELEERFSTQIPEGYLWGCSFPFVGLERFPDYYRQGMYALETVRLKGGVHENIGRAVWGCLSQQLKREPWMSSLVSPDLKRLWRSDEENGSRNVAILEAFLLHGCNYTDTAHYLDMHRNTLIYRMDRIREQLTGRLEDAEYRKLLLASCLLL